MSTPTEPPGPAGRPRPGSSTSSCWRDRDRRDPHRLHGRNFFSTGNIRAILTFTSVLGFIAIGQTLVILVGSLDLSVPFVTSLSSVVAGGTMAGQPERAASGAGQLAPRRRIGLANGLIVSLLGVHGFVATLGMGLIISGYLATNYQGSSGSAPSSFQTIGATPGGPVPVSTLIMLGCAAAAILLLRRTRTGHHLYAVGGNREVARLSGIHTAVPIVPRTCSARCSPRSPACCCWPGCRWAADLVAELGFEHKRDQIGIVEQVAQLVGDVPVVDVDGEPRGP